MICDSETNVNNCNGATNSVCWQVNNTGSQKDVAAYQNTTGDCFAAAEIPGGLTVDYATCVVTLQGMIDDCVNPSGGAYSKTKQGGYLNIHYDDTKAGVPVDKKLPSYSMGAAKCMGRSSRSVVFSPTGGLGGVELAP